MNDGVWEKVCEVLTDFEFLQARLGASERNPASTVYDLLDDYLAALEALPAGHAGRSGLDMLWRATDRNTHILRDFPRLLVQQLANTRDWRGTPLEGQIREAERTCPWVWLRLLNARTEGTDPLLRFFLCLGFKTVVAYPVVGVVGSASVDGSVVLWDVRTGRPLWGLENTGHGYNVLAISHNRRLLATGNPVAVWELETGRLLVSPEGYAGSLAFSPDGRALAAACIDHLCVWEAETGRVLFSFACGIHAVAYDPAGQRLVGIGKDGLWLWDVNARCLLYHLQEWPSRHLGAVAFGNGILSVGVHVVIELRAAATGQPLRLLQGHSQPVAALAFSADGKVLASGGRDQSVILWEVASGQLLTSLRGHSRPVVSVAFSPDGFVLASSDGDLHPVEVGSAIPENEIRLWDVGMSLLASDGQQEGGGRVLAFHPGRRLLAGRDEDGTVRVWQADTGQLLHTSKAYPRDPGPLAFSPDGEVLASGGEDRSVLLWEIATGRLLSLATRPDPWLGSTDFTPWLFAVALSPDRSRAAAGGNLVGVVRVWEVETRRLLWAQAPDDGFVEAIAIDTGGCVLASGHGSGAVRLWDLATGQSLFALKGHRGHVRTAAFRHDGQILATGGGHTDNKICLWDTHSSRLLRSFEAHRGVSAVAFSPDGRTLASGGRDQWVRLWDPETGKGVARFRCDGPVRGVWFDPSAPYLFVADGVRRRPPDVCRLEIVGR